MSALKKIASTFIAVCMVTAMVSSTTVTAANAGPRWDGPRHHRDYRHHPRRDHYRDHHRKRHHSRKRHHRKRDHGGEVAAGIIGLGAGLILGNALSNSNSNPTPPRSSARYNSPRPWTPQWRAYCSSKYRSFNPRTGYFLGYDGDYHFCR